MKACKAGQKMKARKKQKDKDTKVRKARKNLRHVNT